MSGQNFKSADAELQKLCKNRTSLDEFDIAILLDLSKQLQMIADLAGKDIFIDCLTSDKQEAIVVCECKPGIDHSIYIGSVVGERVLMANEPAVLRTLLTGIPTMELKGITQENRTVRQNVIPVKNGDKIIGALISETDITERLRKSRQMEILEETTEQLAETLMTFNENSSVITQHIQDAVIVFDKNNLATYANPEAKALYRRLGYIDDITGMFLDNLKLNDKNIAANPDDDSVFETEAIFGEITIKIKYVCLAANANKNISLIMVLRDISEIRAKEKELILRSVAMKEVHHRIKNNLQTIASLLRMQYRRCDNDYVKKIFNENINRILSVATTHEILAKNGIEDAEITQLLTRIKDSVIRSYAPLNETIAISVSGDIIYADSDTAAGIALIVNELLSNSLEHAFTERNEGRIEIIVKKDWTQGIILVIDNGCGFDDSEIHADCLGLTIVKAMVQDKLHSALSIESNSSGTKVSFGFHTAATRN